MTSRWSTSDGVPRGDDYDARWRALAAAGQNPHGEADFVERLWQRMNPTVAPGHEPSRLPTVLDAGCGTGRLAIELARRGYDVEGVDLDHTMLATARAKAPTIPWHLADLVDVKLERTIDLVVMAGNVMIFLAPGSEHVVIANLASQLAAGGLLVSGFELRTGRFDLDAYDRACDAAGLSLVERHATWHDDPFDPAHASYAVSVHRRS